MTGAELIAAIKILSNLKKILKIIFFALVFVIMFLTMISYGVASIFTSFIGSSPVLSQGYALPVDHPYVYTSKFGPRKAPKAGASTFHKGVDMAVPIGRKVYAVKSGEINYMKNEGKGGIALGLQGDDGRWYYYAHLSGYAFGMKVGLKVQVGQVVAFSGNTGNSTGPHLHFGTKENGNWVDPMPLLKSIEEAIKYAPSEDDKSPGTGEEDLK